MSRKLLFPFFVPMLIIVLAIAAYAQTPAASNVTESWAHTWGGGGDDELAGVAVDGGGNVYLTDSTASFGSGGFDVLLLKYSQSGVLLCRQTWGGSGNDYGRDIAVNLSNGSVYVAGGTESSASGNTDILLLKFDSNCNFIWAQSWDLGGREDASRVKIDPSDGGLVVGGRTGIASATEMDALLMKVSDPGSTPPQAPLWATTWHIWFQGVSDFFFTVTGGIESIYACGPTIPPGSNGIDGYFARYDSNGTLQWLKTWNRAINDSAFSCTSDGSGNMYISGFSGEWAGSGHHDVYLLKLDPSGALQWAKTWGSGANDFGLRVVTDTSGNVYVVGQTNGFNGGQSDILLLKYDTSGNLLLSNIRRGNGDSSGVSALVTADGILLAGVAPNNGGSWQALVGTPGLLKLA